MEDNTQILYQKLYDNGLYTKTYDDFKNQWLVSPEKIQELYSTLTKGGYYTKSLDEFNAQYIPIKKKVSAETLGEPSFGLPQENIKTSQKPLEDVLTPQQPLPSAEEPTTPASAEQPKQAKTVGEWILGGAKAFDQSLAGLASSLDYVHTSANDAINQIIFGKETAVGLKKMREEGTLLPAIGGNVRPFEAIANAINYAHSGSKPLPTGKGTKGVAGDVISGVVGIVPDIIASVYAPEVQLPKILSKFGLQTGSKFGMVMGAKATIEGARSTEEGTPIQKVEAPVLGAIEGYMTGWMFDGIGAQSGKIGERIADKLMPKVTTRGQAINKALVQQGGSMLTNANIFGGYGVADEYLRTGTISPETFATNAGIGIGLGLREPAKLLYAKGLNAFIATPKEAINRVINNPTSAEQLAKDAQDKINAVESGTSADRESDLAAAKLSANMANLKAVTDEIVENKDEVIRSVSDSELEPKAKELIIDKINAVDADNDPKVLATKEVNDKIADIDEQLNRIRENKSWDEARKEVESAPLKEKKLALKEEAISILNKPIKEELKLGDKTFKSEKELTDWLDENYNETDRFTSVNEEGYLEPNTMKVFNKWYKENKERLQKEDQLKIEEETKDAERIRTAVTETGEQAQGLVEGEEGGLRVRDTSQDRVEAVTGEEVAPQESVQKPAEVTEVNQISATPTEIDPIKLANEVKEVEWYHGTKNADLTKGVIDPWAYGDVGSLVGLGLYTTADTGIARKYAGQKGRIFKFKFNPSKVINGDTPLTQDVIDAYKKSFTDDSQVEWGGMIDEFLKKKPNASLVDLHRAILEEAEFSEISKDSVVEQFQDVSFNLSQLGYDGITHEGGKALNQKTRHRVLILFDPESVYNTEKTNIVSSRGEYIEKPAETPKEAITAPIEEKTPEVPPPVQEPPKVAENAPKEEGIKYKDKTYQSVEQLQDDYDSFGGNFAEYNKVLEKVRSFEDGLRTEAKQKSKKIRQKLELTVDNAEDKYLKSSKYVITDLNTKFFPIDISRANTALWKRLSKVRDKASNWTARKMQEGMVSQNDAARWVAKSITNWYGGLGRTEQDIMGKLKMVGTTKEFAPYEAKQLQTQLLKIVDSDLEALQRVRDVLDPEIGTLYSTETKQKLTYDDLTPSEQLLHDSLKDLNTWVHETNYANGFLPTDTYLKNRDKYIARMYDTYELPPEVENFINRAHNSRQSKLQTDIYKQRKELQDWNVEHAITDPVYLTTKRVMQTIQNEAIKEYMDLVVATHPEFVKDVKMGEAMPKGFTKLGDSYRWGGLRGKAVANHIVEDFSGYFFANEAMNSMYNAMKVLDRNGITQFFKKWHTVYNPFVQTGNFTGNLFFSSIAGINPAVLISEMPDAVRDAKAGTAEYKSLLRSGILGATGVTGDMTPLTSLNKPTVQKMTVMQNVLTKIAKTLTKADEATVKLYQQSDNVAKYAAYKVFRKQGLSHEQAVRRVYDSFQNYSTVGKTWDVASKTPVFGNKFVKFQADLQRILANGLTMSPLTTIGTIALVGAMGTLASRLSGEDEEEKKVRETRKGVAKIPFIGTPLSFKIGKKEVNAARYLSPLYLYRYGDSDADLAEISKFLPFQVQKVEKPQLGEKGYAPSFGDPVLGWIAQIVADRDFRGMSIQNPQASKYFNPNITTEERLANVMNYVGRAQVPFYKSAQDVYDGLAGNLDYYGRKRTWSDAILNNLIKIQEFDKPELKRYVEGNIGYLTSRFASLSARMGDANSSFLKTIKNAKEQGMSEEMLDKLYETQDEIRTKRLQRSLEQQVPVMEEIERLTGVYKKWYPNDPFLQENFMNIETGKNQRFNVMDDIDLQKKYKEEYLLLKDNGLLRRPEVPNYYQGRPLTDAEKKEYTSTYWSEYVRNIDAFIGLTQEEFDEYKETVIGMKDSTKKPTTDEYSLLQKLATKSAERAKKTADIELSIK